MEVLRRGKCQFINFFYPNGDALGMEDADVTLYENGIVEVFTDLDQFTTHLTHCELIWSHKEPEPDKPETGNVRQISKKTNKGEGNYDPAG